MLSKTKRSRAAKTVRRRKISKLSKKVTPSDEIATEEVVSLELEASRQSRSELTWLSMTAEPHSKEDEHWNGVEEHLLTKGLHEQDSERRWKYFSK